MLTEVGIILRNFAENPKDREKRFFILKRRGLKKQTMIGVLSWKLFFNLNLDIYIKIITRIFKIVNSLTEQNILFKWC